MFKLNVWMAFNRDMWHNQNAPHGILIKNSKIKLGR